MPLLHSRGVYSRGFVLVYHYLFVAMKTNLNLSNSLMSLVEAIVRPLSQTEFGDSKCKKC